MAAAPGTPTRPALRIREFFSLQGSRLLDLPIGRERRSALGVIAVGRTLAGIGLPCAESTGTLLVRMEAMELSRRGFDMDSTEIPVCRQQERSA